MKLNDVVCYLISTALQRQCSRSASKMEVQGIKQHAEVMSSIVQAVRF